MTNNKATLVDRDLQNQFGFVGAGLAPQVIYREVQTVDVAVTLSAFMGIKPPSGSAGVPLEEVVAK